MKLRSEKVLGLKELPPVLQIELFETLLEFKELLTGNNALAKEVLIMISNAWCLFDTYNITDVFENQGIQDENNALGVTCSSLVGLVVGDHHFYSDQNINPIYHNEIKDIILTFSGDLLDEQDNVNS